MDGGIVLIPRSLGYKNNILQSLVFNFRLTLEVSKGFSGSVWVGFGSFKLIS
jgi:hypothetical protein